MVEELEWRGATVCWSSLFLHVWTVYTSTEVAIALNGVVNQSGTMLATEGFVTKLDDRKWYELLDIWMVHVQRYDKIISTIFVVYMKQVTINPGLFFLCHHGPLIIRTSCLCALLLFLASGRSVLEYRTRLHIVLKHRNKSTVRYFQIVKSFYIKNILRHMSLTFARFTY